MPGEVRGELQALTVSQPRCEGLCLQSLRLLVQELHVILDPLLSGVHTDLSTPLGLEYHSCHGTLGAGFAVALQPQKGELPRDYRKAAGIWNG